MICASTSRTCQSRMSGFERPVLAPPLPARVHGISWRRFAVCIAWVCRSFADGVGGFPALAAVAFGAVGGISHGVAQKESFKARERKSPPAPGGGGARQRIYVHELDRYFNEDQLNTIFDAKGGKSRFGCNDTNCCRHGPEDMVENAHAHFITQRYRQLDD